MSQDYDIGIGDMIAFAHQLGRCGCGPDDSLQDCPELAANADTIREEETSGRVRKGWVAIVNRRR
jgi:hypothetical protein